MRLSKIVVTSLLVAGFSVVIAPQPTRAETTPYRYKWVDANRDCVSTCAIDQGWICPCVIL